jgi:hypothetical protein
MLNPVPLWLSTEDGGLRLGFPALDRPDHRDLSDVGLTREQWEMATRRGAPPGWARICRALRRAVGSCQGAASALAHGAWAKART